MPSVLGYTTDFDASSAERTNHTTFFMSIVNTILSRRGRQTPAAFVFLCAGALPSLYIPQRWSVMGCLRAADIDRRFHLHKKKRQQPEKPTAGVIVADRVGFEPTSRLRDYLISSLVRTWHFRVCCGR